MTLIHTCELNGVNPFEYLVAAMGHSDDVEQYPANWLPWNYRGRLEELPAAPSSETAPSPTGD